MYGAIAGDMIGSPYEWHNIKTKEFPLFRGKSHFTDDTVMTLAVAAALMKMQEWGVGPDDEGDIRQMRSELVYQMRKWGKRYPNAGYGGRFYEWIFMGGDAYNSWGNGSAMRVSPVAWLYDDIGTVRKVAAITAAVTHDHPEGIKGAEAIASAVFLARTGASKEEIRSYVTQEFGYDLDRSCEEIRPGYEFDVSCQGSVPEAIIAFLEGEDYADVVRTAVSLGGDSDTIGAMAGSIAEAFYGMPDDIIAECKARLPEPLLEVAVRLEKQIGEGPAE
ncbi:MAG: ADP-ribosylglycohydrolase family protein [Mogibacterium sp.]|nr:ADP-ribosylglycohydrolase family protein [Mogibacterium sp.]